MKASTPQLLQCCKAPQTEQKNIIHKRSDYPSHQLAKSRNTEVPIYEQTNPNPLALRSESTKTYIRIKKKSSTNGLSTSDRKRPSVVRLLISKAGNLETTCRGAKIRGEKSLLFSPLSHFWSYRLYSNRAKGNRSLFALLLYYFLDLDAILWGIKFQNVAT